MLGNMLLKAGTAWACISKMPAQSRGIAFRIQETLQMYEFFTTDNKKLTLGVNKQGITFIYSKANGKVGDALEVGQNWSSINSILCKLRNEQRYSSRDNSLAIWKQSDRLCVKFRALDVRLEETLTFSNETTDEILYTLQSFPSLN